MVDERAFRCVAYSHFESHHFLSTCSHFFRSHLPGSGGVDDPFSMHSAEPVVSGEKWVATRWFAEEKE